MAIKYIEAVHRDAPSAVAAPKSIQATITAISKANGAVVTAANDFSDGDIVVVTGVAGMTEINFLAGTVASSSSTGFTLTEINSTGFTTYTSGGIARKIMTLGTGKQARLLYDDSLSKAPVYDSVHVLLEKIAELGAVGTL